MVKTPKMHSKSRREPVTIDLDPGAVSRIVDENPSGTPTAAEQSPMETAEPASHSPDVQSTQAQSPQAQTPEEPVHADQADLEPWEHSNGAAAQASAEQGTKAEPEHAYPGSDAPFARPAASDYSFDDATTRNGKAGQDTGTTEARGDTMAVQPKRGLNGIAAGIIGGVIALAGAGALQYAGLLGAPGSGASLDGINEQVAALNSDVAGLKEAGRNNDADGRIATLSSSLDQVKADVSALKSTAGNAGAGDSAAVAALTDKVGQIEAAVSELGKAGSAAPVDLAPINEKLAGLDALVKAAGEAATAQNGRLAALEQSVTQLSGKVEAQASQPKIALAIAASALKAALDRGAGFSAELDTFAAISPDAPQIAALRPYAEKGIPTRAEIASEADAAATAMIGAATPVDQNAGFLQNLMSSAQSLVKVRPIGAVQGPGVPETVARMEVAVNQGDYAKALSEYETLPDAAKAAGAEFAAKLKARLEAESQVDALISSAMKA
jgi:hypothetical protein